MGPELVVATTLASAGLQVAGGISKARGEAAGYQYKEAQAQRQAFAARTAADQTDAGLRDELSVTLGNIAAIRAAAGVGADSPTGMAIEDRNATISDRQRRIRVGNYMTQADQSDADARYFNYAAGSALETGYLNAFGTGLKSLSGLSRSKAA